MNKKNALFEYSGYNNFQGNRAYEIGIPLLTI